MNPLSQPILDAIDAAVKMQIDGTIPPDIMRGEYQAVATTMLAEGKTEGEVILQFQQLANPQN